MGLYGRAWPVEPSRVLLLGLGASTLGSVGKMDRVPGKSD